MSAMDRPDRSLALAALLFAAGCADEPACEERPPWTDAAELPGPRLEPGVAAMGTRLIVVGGFSSGSLEISRQVLALDTFSDGWIALPDAPVAWTHANVASIGGTLLLLGGLSGSDFVAHGESYALDLGGQVWAALPAMPPGYERGAAGVVVSPPSVFLLGGASSTGAHATNLVFDLRDGSWSTTLPDLPVARSHAAAMRMDNGTLIVAGGLSELNAPLSDVWALPLGATAWEPRTAMPTARGGCAYGAAGGQLVCAGGEAGSAALIEVESYNPVLDIWTTQPALTPARAGTQGAMIGQRLFVPGGSNTLAFEPVATVSVFSLIDTLPRCESGADAARAR